MANTRKSGSQTANAATQTVSSVVGSNTFVAQSKIQLQPLTPQTLPTLEITEDQASRLAMTRSRRFSEFWCGAWLGTIPGAWGPISKINWTTMSLPTDGHLIELALFTITGTMFLRSLLNFKDPTAEELLVSLFPNAARPGLVERGAAFIGRVIKAFRNGLGFP